MSYITGTINSVIIVEYNSPPDITIAIPFDIDELIENMESLMKEGTQVASDNQLPVYMRLL